jgi:DNA-binding LacI/PurR family transcriptional regulator
VAAERRRGYRTAMHRHGLAAHARIVPGGLTEESGAAAATIAVDMADSLPTAIVAFNDRCAVGLLGAFMRAASTSRRTSRSSGTTMITCLACRTSTSRP